MATSTATLNPVTTTEMPQPGAWTYADYLRLPEDGKRYEVINGELLEMPAPTTLHQLILFNLTLLLGGWIKLKKLGIFLQSPVDVLLINASQIVQPDALFISSDQKQIFEDRAVNGSPRLLIEVLSPSTARSDRTEKFTIYEQAGVKEYWLINPKTESLEVFFLEGTEFALVGEYAGDEKPESPVLGKLEFELSELFKI